jgi:hypothetical protein
MTGPATSAPAASTSCAIPVGGAIPAEPHLKTQSTVAPANIGDQLTTAVRLLFDGLQPGAADDVNRLQDCDPDQPRLLGCLGSMMARAKQPNSRSL